MPMLTTLPLLLALQSTPGPADEKPLLLQLDDAADTHPASLVPS